MVKKRRYWIPIGKRFCGDFYRWNNYWADRTVNRSWSNQKFTFSTRTICQTWHFFRLNTFLSLRIEIAKIAVNVVKTQPREIVSEKDHKLWFIALLMAQWVDMEAEKITHWAHVDAWTPFLRLIQDCWFVGPLLESVRRVIFIFSTHWAIRSSHWWIMNNLNQWKTFQS